MFSVSISVYDRDDPVYFKKAIQSIIDQTTKPDQIVLVVDGPINQKLRSIIGEFENTISSLDVIWLKKNMGHGFARRIGLKNCKNNLVAIMDSDDIAVHNRFERQLAIFQIDPELSVLGGQIQEFNAQKIFGIRSVGISHEQICKQLKYKSPFNQMTVMLNKMHIEGAGGYQDCYCNEDYYLWTRLFLQKRRFQNLKEILVKVRVDDQTFKRRGGLSYFTSEVKLQKFMLKNGITNYLDFIFNVTVRFIVQIILPNKIRKVIFKGIFRKKS